MFWTVVYLTITTFFSELQLFIIIIIFQSQLQHFLSNSHLLTIANWYLTKCFKCLSMTLYLTLWFSGGMYIFEFEK